MPDTNVNFISPPDNFCAWRALAFLAYADDENPEACQESYAQALACKSEGSNGHDSNLIKTVAYSLSINCMTLTDFLATCESVRKEYLSTKNVAPKIRLLPCIIMDSGHASIAIDRRYMSKKHFSYSRLTEAFLLPSSDPGKAAPLINDETTRIKKLKRKIADDKIRFCQEKQKIKRESRERYQKTMDADLQKVYWKVRNYNLRRIMKMKVGNLPQTDLPNDAIVALYCMDTILDLQ